MDNLSVIEKKLYDYIKEKKEVTFEDIERNLGSNFLGAIGKLIQTELVEKGEKRQVISAFPGVKYLKTLKIKE